MRLNEDALYRSSTQYKHWSFTPAQLVAQRTKTNVFATERVKANVARQRAQRAAGPETESSNGSGANTPSAIATADTGREVDCLTVDEELALVDEFCERALQMGTHCKFPIEVAATAVQFLRRFYLSNSPMTYHGQNISRTAMFLAGKTENSMSRAETFAENFKKVTAEQILAPEYLVVQALRFNFEVKHPFRGLKGGHLELMSIVSGKYEGVGEALESAADVQSRMLSLPQKEGSIGTRVGVAEMQKRVANAYARASQILKTAAQLTDAYFLYTPPQIWMAAHLIADEPLTIFFLGLKVPAQVPAYAMILSAIRACADLLSSHRSLASAKMPAAAREASDVAHKAFIKKLVDKLKLCRDPDKLDLVKLNQAQKRDAVRQDALDEHKAKKRKTERENYEKEADNFWGPELPQNGAKDI